MGRPLGPRRTAGAGLPVAWRLPAVLSAHANAAHRGSRSARRTSRSELRTATRPLSGRRDATAFHLEVGRLCVLASRRRQACIVVARAGIADLLDAHFASRSTRSPQ
jgi:hypothetical protein